MKVEKKKLGALKRVIQLERGMVGEDRRVTFSAASEEPYLRYSWSMGEFYEVLDLSPGSVSLERLRDGGPLLKDHDTYNQIGVIESALIRDRRLEVTARFGNSQAAIDEQKDVEDGIRTKVSVGYLVDEMVLEKQAENGPDTYRVTKWTPLEVSTVSIPADPTVGFGRAEGDAFREHETRVIWRESAAGGEKMDLIMVIRREDGALVRIRESAFDEKLHERYEQKPASANPRPVVETRGSETVDRAAIEKAERERSAEILAIGAKHNCMDKAREAVRDGVSLAAFRDHVWASVPQGKPVDTPVTEIGLSQKEAESFSFRKAILACIDHDWSDAGFERECSNEVAKRLDRKARGFFVPNEVRHATYQSPSDQLAHALRTLTVGTATAGGNIVAKELHPEQFIELLRNKMMVRAMGAQILSGLVGNVDLPRQSGGATASFVGEASNVSTSELTVDLVSMQPRTLGVRSDMSRKLLLQSTPAIEGLVRNDIATALALGIDKTALTGSGTAPTPRGILNVSGIGLVSLGTNGAVPSWDSQVQLIEAALTANADRGALGYLATGKAWSKLMRTQKVTGFPEYILSEPGNTLLGRRFEVTEQLPSNLVKGTSGAVCSAEIYGNWNELIIGEWGVLDLFPDPYTLADSNGLVLRAFQDIDVAVRHAQSFAVIVDMLTT